VTGGLSNETISAGTGADSIDGGAGDDKITGVLIASATL